MSPKVKQFGSGFIVSSILVPIILAVFYWIGKETTKIPTLENKIAFEVSRLNDSILRLQKTADETNKALKNYTKYHAENLARITQTLVNHKYKIEFLNEKCNDTKKEVDLCMKHTSRRSK